MGVPDTVADVSAWVLARRVAALLPLPAGVRFATWDGEHGVIRRTVRAPQVHGNELGA